jgi:hypothetical protein
MKVKKKSVYQIGNLLVRRGCVYVCDGSRWGETGFRLEKGCWRVGCEREVSDREQTRGVFFALEQALEPCVYCLHCPLVSAGAKKRAVHRTTTQLERDCFAVK